MGLTATLLVEVPAGPYEAERHHALAVVLGTFLGVAFRVVAGRGPEVRLSLVGRPDGPALRLPDGLFATPRARWLTPASLPARPLGWAHVPAELVDRLGARRLPILFGDPGGPAWARSGDGWRLAIDVFGSAFFMLTRYEEAVLPDRDAHGRFPAAASVAGGEGLLGRPIVDEYVVLLRAAMDRLWPGLARPAEGYRPVLTHDVDHPFMPRSTASQAARAAAADVLTRRDPALAWRRLGGWLGGPTDPYDTFGFMMDRAERHGLSSAFYFIPENAVPGLDGDYALDDPRVLRLIGAIRARGHEIGFHPSYGAANDPARVAREFAALRRAAGRAGVRQDRWGGRHHFLRGDAGATWRSWADAGLAYDSSIGYAEAVGFRSGTCHPHPTFDLARREPLALLERPLIAMETTLLVHHRLAPAEALAELVRASEACRRVGGEFMLVWHNSHLITRSQRRLFDDMLAIVAAPAGARRVC